jgi:hypothetical protein
MKSFDVGTDDSEATVAGEWLESVLLNKFSLKEKESKDNLAKIEKSTATWKTKHATWKKKEKTRKNKWLANKAAKLKALENELKTTKDKDKSNVQSRIDTVNKEYYAPTTPPFPAASVSLLTQAEYLAKNEYIPKPYDVEALVELIEGSQRLKSATITKAITTVGLGATYRPTNSRNVADFTPEELDLYYAQGKELLAWLDARTIQGEAFYHTATKVNLSRNGIGEGYFEVVDSRIGEIKQIRYISGVYIWEGQALDRYIYIQNGQKKYFK